MNITILGTACFALASPARAQNVEWTRQFGTAATDYAMGVTADGTGGTYVTGYTRGALPGQNSSGDVDAYVRRYDAGGTEVWTRQFGNAGGNFATAVTDEADGVYIAGTTMGALPGMTSSGQSDAFLRRYDEGGNVVWTRQFGSAGLESVWAVASDGSGGAYVAGSTDAVLPGRTSAGLIDAWVRRYDVSGNEMWTQQFGTAFYDGVLSVERDGTGGAYVGGYADAALPGQTSSGQRDAFVRRYDAGGSELWTRQFGSAYWDDAEGMATDGAGGVYVGGSTVGALPGQTTSGAQDAFVRRYDANGAELWTRQVGSGSADATTALAADGAGGVYLAGHTFGTLRDQSASGGWDAFAQRYDASGSEVWTRQFGSSTHDFAFGLASDGAGGLAVAGATSGSLNGQPASGDLDAFVIRWQSPTCWNTSNTEGNENGPVSGAAHSTIEPVSGALGSTVHETNCTILVPQAL